MKENEDMIEHISLKGAIFYFPIRKPIIQEYKLVDDEGRSYDLTYDSPE